jgi:hypothetical protein
MNAPGSPSSDAIARLEARVRWLTSLSTFLTLGLVALAAWQFAPRAKVVEANAFVLRDTQWRKRGVLGLRLDGSPMLRLDSVNGRERVLIGARDDGRAVIRFSDGKDVFRARIELDAQGAPRLLMSGSDGSTRVAVAPLGSSSGGIRLFGDDEKAAWAAP